MIKFRWYYDKDKEEKFLNSMSAKGYAMTKYFLGFYFFTKCEPGEYTYRVDLIRGKTDKEKHDYISLIKETGAEFVQEWGFWVFFRKKGEFELYTDAESMISVYKRIRSMFASLMCIEVWCLAMVVTSYLKGIKAFLPVAILLTAVILVFLYQIIICTKKMKDLEDSDE